ncbi:hypothetical protein [Paenibacillus sp. ICGEB2008]|uniref:hypothetical protein n=1 Tax=Paenibacillus sp. ICGEB2008 TaxID=996640 RepID=UPI00037BED2D|nr:hypothetical protein [Paenibacillus sp. ICGEB2008]KKD53948.1 hypothetical protein C400_16065 [Paenibacillus sp. ICGEB2008]
MFSSNLQEADTFKPMVVELELSYLDLNIQEVELKWLEIIKKKIQIQKSRDFTGSCTTYRMFSYNEM